MLNETERYRDTTDGLEPTRNEWLPGNSDFSLQQLFHAALEVRQLIKESKGVDSRWPSNSHDLTLALATKSIPIKLFQLFGMVSWIIL